MVSGPTSSQSPGASVDTPWHNDKNSRECDRGPECLPDFSQVASDIDAVLKGFADLHGPVDKGLASAAARLREHSRRLTCMVQGQLESSFAHEHTARLDTLGRAMKVITRLPGTGQKAAVGHALALAKACSSLLKFHPEVQW
ncbi:DUF6415 family natural product biosynthesis protein [Streptomyces triculaminicus]|uniref:DUF6415 family natural product biosynthesis protein n=1 Tax=Streptomyces triculaminicus TaxID=2816232 RepID=UPI00379A51B1